MTRLHSANSPHHSRNFLNALVIRRTVLRVPRYFRYSQDTIGEVYDTERVERRDWKNMDWDAYTEESRIPLQCLIRDWDENETDACLLYTSPSPRD